MYPWMMVTTTVLPWKNVVVAEMSSLEEREVISNKKSVQVSSNVTSLEQNIIKIQQVLLTHTGMLVNKTAATMSECRMVCRGKHQVNTH